MESSMAAEIMDKTPADVAGDAFQDALAEATTAQEQVAVALRELADNPDPGGPREAELLAAMDTRRKAATRLGFAILGWQALGGEVVLEIEATEEETSLDDVLDLLDETPTATVLPLTPPERPQEEPKPEPAVRVPPSVPAASEADLAKLVNRFKMGAPPRRTWEDDLRDILKDLGKPQPIKDLNTFHNELSLLERASRAAYEQWEPFQQDIRRGLMGLCVARLRHVQDEVMPKLGHPFVGDLMNRIFSQFTAYSRDTKPGFVFGLSRGHQPEEPTWLQEALTWWKHLHNRIDPKPETGEPKVEVVNPEKALHHLDGLAGEDGGDRQELCKAVITVLDAGVSPDDTRLVKILLPHLGYLSKEPRLRSVRKALREYKKELSKEAQEAEADAAVLPEDWPFWEYTRGKNAVLVGGDKRDRTVKRFQEVFGFADIEWESGWEIRRLDALAHRVEQGNVDIVILLARFLSHTAWDALVPACKEAGIPFVLVERGYGVSQVQATMEMVLGRLQGNE